MKKLGLLMMLLILSRIALFCQSQTAGIEEKEVLKNEDVVFRQIDEHTESVIYQVYIYQTP